MIAHAAHIMNLANTACTPGQVRQVGQHNMIFEQSQTDHVGPSTPYEEMSSGPRSSAVEADVSYSLGCVHNQNARGLCKHEQTIDVGGGRAC